MRQEITINTESVLPITATPTMTGAVLWCGISRTLPGRPNSLRRNIAAQGFLLAGAGGFEPPHGGIKAGQSECHSITLGPHRTGGEQLFLILFETAPAAARSSARPCNSTLSGSGPRNSPPKIDQYQRGPCGVPRPHKRPLNRKNEIVSRAAEIYQPERILIGHYSRSGLALRLSVLR